MIRFFNSKALLSACSLVLALAFQDGANQTFTAWHRVSETPVISPQGNGWESAGTFNPAVVIRDAKIIMLYRAQDKEVTARLAYAESSDGVRFARRVDPGLPPSAEY